VWARYYTELTFKRHEQNVRDTLRALDVTHKRFRALMSR